MRGVRFRTTAAINISRVARPGISRSTSREESGAFEQSQEKRIDYASPPSIVRAIKARDPVDSGVHYLYANARLDRNDQAPRPTIITSARGSARSRLRGEARECARLRMLVVRVRLYRRTSFAGERAP